MKYETKQIKKDLVQITTSDERWYQTGEKFVPSVTWICSHYPKGIQFMKWLASKGWNDAESIKESAGDKGSRIHHAIEALNTGMKIRHNTKIANEGVEAELTGEEYEAVISYADWFKEVKPKIIKAEHAIITDNYGGTIDIIAKIGKQKWIIDVKSSQYIWAEHKLQVSAYKHAMKNPEDYKIAILNVGYKRNKRKYKFTEVEDKMDLFRAAYKIWQEEVSQKNPPQINLPLSIKLT